MIRLLFILFSLSLVVAGCGGSRSMLKEAHTLEQGGLTQKAFEKYNEVYQQHGKVEGLVGMRRIAQAELNSIFQKAQMECMRGNYESALQTFDQGMAYHREHSALQLNVPASAETQRASCSADYINFLYESAEAAVKDERYEEAQQLIRKLRSIDRNNKKAEYLDLLSRIYPNYNKGVKAMELGYWREGYDFFNEVVQLDAGFKDALQRMNECLEKAKFSIAYVPVEKKEVADAMERALSGAIKQQILQLRSPFIELVEREHMETLLGEQMNSMTAVFDEDKVIEAGKLIGARYIITGEIVTYDHKVAPQRSFERKAYLGPTVGSKKVKYTENRLGRGLDASFKFQILDAETGKVFATEIIPFSERDNVVWSDFEGDYTRLYPGEWKWQLMSSKEDVVNVKDRDRLMAEFTGRKGPVSEAELMNRMIAAFADRVGKSVRNFKP
ncbi:MAG: CsgG/HfaB family protein [Flavobacteriales bacterium]|jgi:hypothetical protein